MNKIDQNFWKIKNYLNANGLQVNEGKTSLTEFMVYQKRTKTKGIPPDLTVQEKVKDRQGRTTLQDKLISDSSSCRMLGLNMGTNLTWESHLISGRKALLPALRRQVGLISKIGQNMSKKARLNLANSLIMSRLSYMICIWGNTNETLMKKVQTVQNIAGRMVAGLPRTTRQQDILDSCGWMSMRGLTRYHTLCQIWKTVKWGVPGHLKEKIDIREEDKLGTKPPRLKITAQSYRCKAVSEWNELPIQLRSEDSLKKFKQQLKKWIKLKDKEDKIPDDGDPEDNTQH